MKRVHASFFPTIALDSASRIPLYRQLYEWFRKAIITSQLRPGQRIPSTRSLANELQISRIPVLGAYDQLHAEGYLETLTGSGTLVARSVPSDAPRSFDQARGKPPHPAVRRLSRHATTTLAPRPQSWLDGMGAFRVSLPALEHFPLAVWSKLVARHSRNTTRSMMAYGDPKGYLPFREAIAEYLGMARAVRCDASQVIIVTGSQQGLQIAARVLLNANDQVWMEEPGYPGAHQVFNTVDAQMKSVPVDAEGLQVNVGVHHYPRARAVYITPSHQYPLGMPMSAARRMQLLHRAVDAGMWIIEDDYDSEFRFGGRPLSSLQGMDENDRVIYIGTFSKVLFPAVRLGYLVVPKDLVPAFAAIRDATDVFSSTLYQAVLTEFIRAGHFGRHIRRMRMLYMERRNLLVTALQQQIGEGLEIMSAEAGMHLVALLPHGMDDQAVSRKAATHGISCMPLSVCYLKPPVRGGLILGYGGTDAKQIQEGVRALAAILKTAALKRNH